MGLSLKCATKAAFTLIKLAKTLGTIRLMAWGDLQNYADVKCIFLAQNDFQNTFFELRIMYV